MSVNSVGVNWDQLEVDQTESFLDISPFVREYIGSPLTTSNPASNTGFFSDVKIPQNGNYSHIVVNGGNSLMQEEKKAGAVLEIQVEPPSNEDQESLTTGSAEKPEPSTLEEADLTSSVLGDTILAAKDESLEQQVVPEQLSSLFGKEEPPRSSSPSRVPEFSCVTEEDSVLEPCAVGADVHQVPQQQDQPGGTGNKEKVDAPPKPPRSPGPNDLSFPTDGMTILEPTAVQVPVPTLAPSEMMWTIKRDEPVKLRITQSGPGSETPVTVHQMFQHAVEQYGETPALAVKKEGQWATLTFREYYNECRLAAKSFLKLGLERYHGVGILGFNSPEWFIADIGSILAGGLAVGIYTTNSPEACQYVADNCEANVLVVENHKQLTKILQVKDQLPHLKAIVQYKDELKEKQPNLYTWKEFMELGKQIPDAQLDDVIRSQKANQCCSLIYTSGTTGQPKGVMLSHDNLTWTAEAAGKTVNLGNGTEECIISYLPLSHIAAQLIDIWISMRFGATTYFAEPDALKGSLVNTMREVRPTAFMAVPRVWEKMQEKMQSQASKSSLVKRKVAEWAKYIGLQANYNFMNGNQTVPWGYMLANNLVFKKVRAALGLDRCTMCFTGAAPITKDTLEYFMSLNLPIYELYGMSESTGPHAVSNEAAFRIMSCGKEIPGCSSKLDKPDEEGNGEICFWGRHVFMGYLNMVDKTEEALDQEGWLHSGDLGKHDPEGFLYVTGRIKELIITAGGENIPPVLIEDAVKEELPIVSNAMLIGDKRKFLCMLLTLKCNVDDDGEPTDELTPQSKEFCRQTGCRASRLSEITSKNHLPVFKAIQEGIDRVNAKATSNAQKIQKWTILEKEFSISGGELGPTLKLKRPVVQKMYKDQIEEFYS
ncbi:long-chain-fatty-acid--CoA ligase ACSBG2-like [Acipenser oxyrinchus oxyrinchus]|uniref:long-chain-fatty-acid--CoA ligase n=1 Tax=Acipenser oxyrinchus oxyrinchus TaxID=40147 RepID=A0AAD8LTE6_ACIOX|nr:long-chain-fatty-acid--CoA ligase ACSBG2-like [Acipenser oxyrinchus oxyrinchus]